MRCALSLAVVETAVRGGDRHQDLTQIMDLTITEKRFHTAEDSLMNERARLRSRIFGAACVMVFASSIAFAETAQDANTAPSAAPADAAPKGKAKQSEKKTQEGSQPAKAAKSETKPLKRGQYGTEAEAKAHCRSEVVWVDKDNFNHYAGSREYGVKPGAFACENG